MRGAAQRARGALGIAARAVGRAPAIAARPSSRRLRGALPALALLAACALPAPAAAQDLAIVGGEVRPVAGPAIADGVVLVRGGRIAAVGPRGEVRVPAGVEVLDATGLVVTPGFIDARATLALRGGAGFERGSLIRAPDVRMADHLGELRVPAVFGVEAAETAVHPWVMDGVTTVYVAPGTGNLVAGFGSVVKVAGGRLGAVLDSAAALHVVLGDDPRRRFDAPTTRQGMVALLRQWLARAGAAAPGESFAVAGPAGEIEDVEWPAWRRTPDLDAVLTGARPVRFHAHTPDDVLTALRVAEELGLLPIIEGGYGAHAAAEQLAGARAPVVLAPAMVGGGGAPEEWAQNPEGAARLHRAGVPVAFSTGGSGGRAVTVEAIVARGHGLPADATLRALTLDGARILGVAGRVGSLEPGKDADLVLWSGDPVGTWGETRAVVVDGRVVYRRDGR